MLRHQPIILCLVLPAWTRCEVTGVFICENVSNKSNLGSAFPPPQKDKWSLPAAVFCTPDNHSCANWCSKTTHCLKIYPYCCSEWNSQFCLSSPSRITELLPLLFQTKRLCLSSPCAMAQTLLKQEENSSFQLILLLICLEWSSSLHFLLEKNELDLSFIIKISSPSAKQTASNGTNICINMLAATKKPTLSHNNLRKPSVLELPLHIEILAPVTEVILVLVLPCNSLLFSTCHSLPPALYPSPESPTVEALSPRHYWGSRKPKFTGTHLPQTVWRASWLFRLNTCAPTTAPPSVGIYFGSFFPDQPWVSMKCLSSPALESPPYQVCWHWLM